MQKVALGMSGAKNKGYLSVSFIFLPFSRILIYDNVFRQTRRGCYLAHAVSPPVVDAETV